jgi:hypothetical protein
MGVGVHAHNAQVELYDFSKYYKQNSSNIGYIYIQSMKHICTPLRCIYLNMENKILELYGEWMQ